MKRPMAMRTCRSRPRACPGPLMHRVMDAIRPALAAGVGAMLLLPQATTAITCQSRSQTAEEAIREFVLGEFNGKPDLRLTGAVRTHKPAHEHPDFTRLAVETGGVVSWLADPVVIASSYSFLSFDSGATRAVAKVSFIVSGASRGHGLPGRALVRPPPGNHVVTYTASLVEGCWLIVDPPIPHVSDVKLLAQLTEQERALRQVVDVPLHSKSQKRAYDAVVLQLGQLKLLLTRH